MLLKETHPIFGRNMMCFFGNKLKLRILSSTAIVASLLMFVWEGASLCGPRGAHGGVQVKFSLLDPSFLLLEQDRHPLWLRQRGIPAVALGPRVQSGWQWSMSKHSCWNRPSMYFCTRPFFVSIGSKCLTTTKMFESRRFSILYCIWGRCFVCLFVCLERGPSMWSGPLMRAKGGVPFMGSQFPTPRARQASVPLCS